MRFTSLMVGIMTFIIGLVMIIAPDTWISVMVILLGVSAISNGFFNIFYLRKLIEEKSFRTVVLVRGIISIVVGLVAVIVPWAVVATVWTVMIYMIAIYLVVAIIMELYGIVKLRKAGINVKPYYGEIIASLLLAIILFVIPGHLGRAIVRVLGILLAVCGIGVLVWQWKTR